MLFEIIIPAYNPGPELIEALKSCYNQSYGNYIVTVIDDASSEDVRGLIWDFPKVKYLRNDSNLGPGGARNVGISNSSADIISFLDADDLMHKDKLKNTFEVFQSNPEVDMVCGNYRVLVNRSKLRTPFYKKPISVNHNNLMRQNFVASGSVSVKREVFDQVGLFNEDYWIAEDYDMWLRIAESHNIRYLHKILYYYSVLPGGESLTQRKDIQSKHDANIIKIRKDSMRRMEKRNV